MLVEKGAAGLSIRALADSIEIGHDVRTDQRPAIHHPRDVK